MQLRKLRLWQSGQKSIKKKSFKSLVFLDHKSLNYNAPNLSNIRGKQQNILFCINLF